MADLTFQGRPFYRRTFVGRGADLARLQAAYAAAATGHGGLVMVAGEPGIGKTSLCERLTEHILTIGDSVLIGHCYEGGARALPYLPFVEALRTHVLSSEPDRLRDQMGDGAGLVAHLVPEVRPRCGIAPEPSSHPESDRYRLLQAVTDFLVAISLSPQPPAPHWDESSGVSQPDAPSQHAEEPRGRGLLLLLEDLHDADQGTLDLLVHLSRRLAGTRLLVVGTYRDVEVDRAHPLSAALAELRRIGSLEWVALRGLTAEDVQGMISRTSDHAPPRGLAGAVHSQTDGNPLFVQEVLRFLAESGHVGAEDGRWHGFAAERLASAIPAGLRDVIGQRLSRLSPTCNRMLAVAAVIGRSFDLETLEAVAGVDEETLLAALEEVVRVAVLQEHARPGVVQYRFAHALVRQTLYEELIAPRRRLLHQQVARVLEARYRGQGGLTPERGQEQREGDAPDALLHPRLAEHAAELAEHFSHSTDPADLAKAVRYGEIAAARAASVFAYDEAVRLLERAVQVQDALDPDDLAKRCDLLLAQAEAMLPAGETRRVADEVSPAALRLAAALGDHHRAARACLLALQALVYFGSYAMWHTPEYRRWTELADRYAGLDSPERVRANIYLSDLGIESGRLVDAWNLSLQGFDLARAIGDPEYIFAAANNLFSSPWPAHAYGSLLAVAEAPALSVRDGIQPRTLLRFLVTGGQVLVGEGQRGQAEKLWREIEPLTERSRDTFALHAPQLVEALRATLDGRLSEALAAAEQAQTLLAGLGMTDLSRQVATYHKLRLCLYLGYYNQALEDVGIAQADWWSRCVRPLCLALGGQHAQAREELHRQIQPLRQDCSEDVFGAPRLLIHLQTANLLGEEEVASRIMPLLAPVAGRTGLWPALTCVARHLGDAAVLVGDVAQAWTYYEQALAAAGRIRFRPEIALTQLAMAELFDRAPADRSRDRSHVDLDAVIAELEAMEMRPALERALRARDSLRGRHTRPRPAHPPDGLSARQIEYLGLLARGHTNKEIAAALVVSEAAVEQMLVRLYEKIGARHRAEAIRYAYDHGLTGPATP
jgi:DNA-binding CsgD family transcriptional regulator